jgi:hypothetical protein
MEAIEDVQNLNTGRVYRPESSASSHSRFTPQSSNNSSANLQHRRQSGMADRERVQGMAQSSRRESPGASLLQERLKEKKVARLSERRQSTNADVVSDDGMAKTPHTGAESRSGRDRDGRPSSSGGRPLPAGKKGMGLKEMEEVRSHLLHMINIANSWTASFHTPQTEFRPQTRAFPPATAANGT